MANIMITKRCNLNCSYCFANEFVNDKEIDKSDIEIERFKEILDFIVIDKTVTKLGLIGGEPTCHSKFNEILDILIGDNRINNVVLYTNGILVKKYIGKLKHPKFHLLINCNELENNKSLHKQFIESLEIVFQEMKNRVILGVNYYKKDYNYNYNLNLLEMFPSKKLRVSISVPNNENYEYKPLEYFKEIKPYIFEFFRELKRRHTIPFLDCNIFPACLISTQEMEEFQEWGIDNPLSILKNRQTGCVPVIDILPDYTAVRCFGLSEYTKVNIRDFASIGDLRNYYLRTVDAFAINTYHDSKCANCYKYKTIKCSGGCLIYKIEQILEKKRIVGI